MKKIVKITNMRKKRIELKLSQSDLASKLGLAVSSIGGYERGDNPLDESIAQRLSKVLETDVKSLFLAHKKLKGKFLAK
jgi:transcriptional regulator with XRE-family HTH domain